MGVAVANSGAAVVRGKGAVEGRRRGGLISALEHRGRQALGGGLLHAISAGSGRSA